MHQRQAGTQKEGTGPVRPGLCTRGGSGREQLASAFPPGSSVCAKGHPGPLEQKGLLASTPLSVLPHNPCQHLTWHGHGGRSGSECCRAVPCDHTASPGPREGHAPHSGVPVGGPVLLEWLHHLHDRWCSSYRSQIFLLTCDLFFLCLK